MSTSTNKDESFFHLHESTCMHFTNKLEKVMHLDEIWQMDIVWHKEGLINFWLWSRFYICFSCFQ